MKSCIYVIYCAYDERWSVGLKSLISDIKIGRPSNSLIVVCVFNNRNLRPHEMDFPIEIEYIYGSNVNREFSAWREGWLCIKDLVDDNSLVILANDTITFNQPYNYCIDLSILRFLAKYDSLNNGEPFICGVTENLRMKIISTYITTFLLIMNSKAAQILLCNIDDLSDYRFVELDNSPDNLSLFIQPKNDYAEYIEKWLTLPDSRGWYKAAPLTRNNKLEILEKAKCILLEHRLAYSAGLNNIEIYDLFVLSNTKILRYIYRLRHIIHTCTRQLKRKFLSNG